MDLFVSSRVDDTTVYDASLHHIIKEGENRISSGGNEVEKGGGEKRSRKKVIFLIGIWNFWLVNDGR
jgi:hypothetical protein